MSGKNENSNQGRFSCYIKIGESYKARQAFYFLKGLNNLRTDIIVDMVLRTLGDDINLDLVHMSRGELMSLYNKHVYGMGNSTGQQVMQTPQGNASMAAGDEQTVSVMHKGAEMPEKAISTRSDQNSQKDHLVTESGLPVENGTASCTTSAKVQVPKTKNSQNKGAKVSDPKEPQDEVDQIDIPLDEAELPEDEDFDTNTQTITSLIGDSFLDI